jgi:hypothetical protein
MWSKIDQVVGVMGTEGWRLGRLRRRTCYRRFSIQLDCGQLLGLPQGAVALQEATEHVGKISVDLAEPVQTRRGLPGDPGDRFQPMNRRRQIRFRPVGFVTDSPLEGAGFEPAVPPALGYSLSIIKSSSAADADRSRTATPSNSR